MAHWEGRASPPLLLPRRNNGVQQESVCARACLAGVCRGWLSAGGGGRCCAEVCAGAMRCSSPTAARGSRSPPLPRRSHSHTRFRLPLPVAHGAVADDRGSSPTRFDAALRCGARGSACCAGWSTRTLFPSLCASRRYAVTPAPWKSASPQRAHRACACGRAHTDALLSAACARACLRVCCTLALRPACWFYLQFPAGSWRESAALLTRYGQVESHGRGRPLLLLQSGFRRIFNDVCPGHQYSLLCLRAYTPRFRRPIGSLPSPHGTVPLWPVRRRSLAFVRALRCRPTAGLGSWAGFRLFCVALLSRRVSFRCCKTARTRSPTIVRHA